MNQVDPVASKYASLTPYNYSFNDPVGFNDPAGDDPSKNRDECKVCAEENNQLDIPIDPAQRGNGMVIMNGRLANPRGFDGQRRFTDKFDYYYFYNAIMGWGPKDGIIYNGIPLSVYSTDSKGRVGTWYKVRRPINRSTERNLQYEDEDSYPDVAEGADIGLLAEVINEWHFKLLGDQQQQTQGGSSQVLQASFLPTEFECGNALLNAGSTLVGVSEQGLRFIRRYPNGPRDIARGVSNLIGSRVGTQATANFLKNSFSGTKVLGSKLGALGVIVSTTDYVANFSDKSGYDHASYWTGMGVLAISYAFPVVGILYGGGQLVSYLYNGKSLD
jgi:hypothetical protein